MNDASSLVSPLAVPFPPVAPIAGVTIATVCAGFYPKARADLIPVGRFGAVEEVAEIAIMLARNGYVTGQTINVNGGWYFT